MTTSPIGSSTAASISSASNPSGSTSNAAAGLTQNFNTFLTLLTTQLQNQDPLSPMDTNQFTQQLVSFSQVEQQIDTNNNLQPLIPLQTAGETHLRVAAGRAEHRIQRRRRRRSRTARRVSPIRCRAPTAQTALAVTDASGNVVYTQPGDDRRRHAHLHLERPDQRRPADAGRRHLHASMFRGRFRHQPDHRRPCSRSARSTAVSVNNGAATFNIDGIAVPMSALVTVNPAPPRQPPTDP